MVKLRGAMATLAWITLVSGFLGSTENATAQDRGVELDDLTALRDFAAPYTAPAVSSDGSRIAVVTRTADLEHNVYAHEVHVVETTAPFRERAIAGAGDTVLLAVRGRRSGVAAQRVALWSPDDRWIAYLVGRDGYAELWRVRATGGTAHRVSVVGEHVVGFSWVDEGALQYQSAISAAMLDGELRAAINYGFHADDGFEPIYDVAPRIDDLSPVGSWRVNIRTGERIGIGADHAPIQMFDVGIVPSDPRFAEAESPELALEASYLGSVRRCTSEKCQGELIAAWRVDDHAIIFQRQTGHHGVLSELAVWSLADGTVRSVRVSETRLSACTFNRGRAYCLEDAATQPQRLVSIAINSGAAEVLWNPNPSWARRTLPRIERLDTTNPGGQQSYAHLIYPLGYTAGRRYPLVIVQYHSRGFLRGGTGGEHPILPLSTRGYFVLSVDRPEDFSRSRTMSSNDLLIASELDGSEHAMKAIALEYFLHELEARGLIEPARIGITGMSDGTETLFHMLLTSERHFAAAVTSSPPPDPSVWAIRSREFRARRARFGGMAPWSDADPAWVSYWRRLSPIYHLDRMRTPILFNLAETETLSAMPLVARLQEIGAPHDLFVYPGAYHNKWRPLQIRAAQLRAIAWLDLWLRDVDTPDPRDDQQMTRWRAMRDGEQLTRGH